MKKGLIALIVGAIAVIIYFVFIRKKDEKTVAGKWDAYGGLWTIAQREEALSKLKQWLDYGLDKAENEYPRTHAAAAWCLNQFTDAKAVSFENKDWNKLKAELNDNGVWNEFITYRVNEVTEKPNKRV